MLQALLMLPHEGTPVLSYADLRREVSMVPRADTPLAVCFLQAKITPTLLHPKLEGKKVLQVTAHRIFVIIQL